jgi:uncharacterized protein (TIGR02172 family)
MQKKLGRPIAVGRTAEVYNWQNGQVLKLYFDWFELEAIQYEQRIAQAVYASGLSVPAVGALIQANGRNGLIYQRVEGVEMWAIIGRRPWLVFRYARKLAELHFETHGTTLPVDLPGQYQRLKDKINGAEVLPNDLRSKTLAALETMPAGDRLCHGDFHPGNILVTGPKATIIDWIDATLGNPLADLARTTILLKGGVARQVQNPWHKIAIRALHTRYIRHYFSLRPGGEREYNRWLPIVAAAQLSENISELEEWLLEQARKGFQTSEDTKSL